MTTPRVLFDYDTVLACWRLLAAATYDLKLQDQRELDVDGLRQVTCDDGPGAFLEEATERLLLLTDQLRYEEVVGDGQLTGPAMLIAQLEGWCMCLTSAGHGPLAIQRDDDSDTFADDAAAIAFVRARAASNAPGTKLHQIALALVTKQEQR